MLTLLLFNIVLQFLVRALRQDKEIKGIQIRMEGIKLSLLADNKILYIGNFKDSHTHKKNIGTNLQFQWIAGNKINIQKLVGFPHTTNKISEKEIFTTFYNSTKTNKILGNKLNQETERCVQWKLQDS